MKAQQNISSVDTVTHYYPFGMLMPDRSFSAIDDYRFGFNGQERDDDIQGKGNLNTAMFWEYDSRLGRRWNLDPNPQISISDYACFANNPIWKIDPYGSTVIGTDKKSKENIKGTLSKKEQKFVKFNKDGTLDAKKLNKSKSESENMTSLKALSNSDLNYKFKVTEKDDAGQEFFEETSTNPNNFYRGVTEIPGSETNPSPDKDVWILVGSTLSDRQQVSTTAHEAFGHGYFYELSRKDKSINPMHTYDSQVKSVWDEEFKTWGMEVIKIPSNEKLEQQIKTVTKQALTNYDFSHPKK